MAYKIQYGTVSGSNNASKKTKIVRRIKPKKWIMITVIVTLIIICTTTDLLIPGDAEITKAAMGEMISDLKNGEQVVDAFAAFCQTVLAGG